MVADPTPRAARRAEQREADGVESNSRLTAATAVVLLVLLFIEGLTILRVGQHLDWHVFFGMLLIPPVLVKIGSTTWRFARYYRGAPAYRRKGPPQNILRVLGPLLVVLTVIMFASGVALLLLPTSSLAHRLLFVHKASFILWFAVMVIHVLGHIRETAQLAPLDLARRTRAQVSGASARQWLILISLVAGLVLGLVMLGPTSHYLSHRGFGHFQHG